MTGPTGVGKSAWAVSLALELDGEIIGADAFQIYSGLPILTAQPGPDLLSQVPHHLIGTLPLDQTCDAARYASLARQAIDAIIARGKTPILVGGTGLYIKALTHGLADLPPVDPALREEISRMDLAAALSQLESLDPEGPRNIDIKNPVRVRRALEIVRSTGRPLEEARRQWGGQGSNDFQGILLTRDRDELHARIAGNVAGLFQQGVVEEVRAASKAGPGASRAIGFREVTELIEGKISLTACIEAITLATRRYAKRQLTWCRNQFNFSTIDLTATDSSLEAARMILNAPPA